MRQRTDVRAVYVALEDFIEKAYRETPPIFKLGPNGGSSPLRRFISLQDDALLVLGPRRIAAIPCPSPNTNAGISVLTSVGFSQLRAEDYAEAVQMLAPDIVVGMADVVHGQAPGNRRILKMEERTASWTEQMADAIAAQAPSTKTAGMDAVLPMDIDGCPPLRRSAFFAPVIPVSREEQKYYLYRLQEDMVGQLSGLAIYDSSSIAELHDGLLSLPRLGVGAPESPHRVLRDVSLGMDLFTLPFVGASTDAGIALDVTFPPPQNGDAVRDVSQTMKPMAIDMWEQSHAADLSPLRKGCGCYACTKHHRAYVQHLMVAKEMLGWVLLQIHNLQVMDDFFTGVRASISGGTFEEGRSAFELAYEEKLPEKTGEGPRIRGYQFKTSGAGEAKKNAPAYRTLDDGRDNLADAADAGGPVEVEQPIDVSVAPNA
ncbi:MAG: hypothetical protein M1832_002803 [Thelocarpon impressellum]|nr:MAG: hypothetical protein M1832_002803 [Thelocarpon impressellum]